MLPFPVGKLHQIGIGRAALVDGWHDYTDQHGGMGSDHLQRWSDIGVVGDDDGVVNLASNGVVIGLQSEVHVTLLFFDFPGLYLPALAWSTVRAIRIDDLHLHLVDRVVTFDQLDTRFI